MILCSSSSITNCSNRVNRLLLSAIPYRTNSSKFSTFNNHNRFDHTKNINTLILFNNNNSNNDYFYSVLNQQKISFEEKNNRKISLYNYSTSSSSKKDNNENTVKINENNIKVKNNKQQNNNSNNTVNNNEKGKRLEEIKKVLPPLPQKKSFIDRIFPRARLGKRQSPSSKEEGISHEEKLRRQALELHEKSQFKIHRYYIYAAIWVLGSFFYALFQQLENPNDERFEKIFLTNETAIPFIQKVIEAYHTNALIGKLPLFHTSDWDSAFVKSCERLATSNEATEALQTDENMIRLMEIIQFLSINHKEAIDERIKNKFEDNEKDIRFGTLDACAALLHLLSTNYINKDEKVIKKLVETSKDVNVPFPIRLSLGETMSKMAGKEENRMKLVNNGATSVLLYYVVNRFTNFDVHAKAIYQLLDAVDHGTKDITAVDNLKLDFHEKEILKKCILSADYPQTAMSKLMERYPLTPFILFSTVFYNFVRGRNLKKSIITALAFTPFMAIGSEYSNLHQSLKRKIDFKPLKVVVSGLYYSSLMVPFVGFNLFIAFWKGSFVSGYILYLFSVFAKYNHYPSIDHYTKPPMLDDK